MNRIYYLLVHTVLQQYFSKKTGTENDIPVIKDGGYMLDDKGKPVNNHYIKGFIQTMKDEYSVENEQYLIAPIP